MLAVARCASGAAKEMEMCGLALEHGRALQELEQMQTLRTVLDSVLEVAGESKLLLEVAESLGLREPATHIFLTYEYGVRDDGRGGSQITITGEAVCGQQLLFGGNWSAQTFEQIAGNVTRGPDLEGFCRRCVAMLPAGALLVPDVVTTNSTEG